MRKIYFLFLSIIILTTACRHTSTPDISGIRVNLELQRFEQDFFAIDTNNISAALPALQQKYPVFLADFVQNILGLSLSESAARSDSAIRLFLNDYTIVKKAADNSFKSFDPWQHEIEKGLRYVKYYFPAYHTPEKLITFIGPLDAIFQTPTGKTGDVITRDALAVALQLHLGADADLYQSQTAQALFPKYVSLRFSPQYIPVNCIKNIVDDIYPPNPANKTLLDMCIDKGKRIYLLDKFMPDTPDSLKTGYTAKQLKGCYENEGLIWSFLNQNELIFNSDPLRIQPYVEEGPQTQELGEGSPGQIALFIGWQIVKKFMEKFPDTTLDSLLKMSPSQILADSKYKPH